LAFIIKLLHKIIDESVQFTGDETYYKLVNNMSMCVIKTSTECAAPSHKSICGVTNSDINGNFGCATIFPSKHLISGKNNQEVYFSKIADECLRYARIKNILLNPNSKARFERSSFIIGDDELVIYQSTLFGSYFDNLIKKPELEYDQKDINNVHPSISKFYDNTFLYNTDSVKNLDKMCKSNKSTHIVSNKIKKGFPESFGEYTYDKTNICSFAIIMDIVKIITGDVLTKEQVENALYIEYMKLINTSDKIKQSIVKVLEQEGKRELINQYFRGVIKFNQVVYSRNYILSPFDLWVLLNYYKIPSTFVSHAPIQYILPDNSSSKAMSVYATDNIGLNTIFIILPIIRKNGPPPMYRLIFNKAETPDIMINSSQLDQTQFKSTFGTTLKNIANLTITPETYLNNL